MHTKARRVYLSPAFTAVEQKHCLGFADDLSTSMRSQRSAVLPSCKSPRAHRGLGLYRVALDHCARDRSSLPERHRHSPHGHFPGTPS